MSENMSGNLPKFYLVSKTTTLAIKNIQCIKYTDLLAKSFLFENNKFFLSVYIIIFSLKSMS